MASTWVAFAAWCFCVLPPYRGRHFVLASICTAIAVATLASMGRVVRPGRFVGRWSIGVTGWTLAVALATAGFFVPVGWGLLGLALLLSFVAFGVLVTALVHVVVRGRRRDALLGLASVAAFVLVLLVAHVPISDAGLRFRVQRVADHYRAEAARATAAPAPPDDHHESYGRHARVAREIGGERAIVGWVWAEGIPAREYGVVYDPHNLLSADVDMTTSELRVSTYGCDRLVAAWYWCRFY